MYFVINVVCMNWFFFLLILFCGLSSSKSLKWMASCVSWASLSNVSVILHGQHSSLFYNVLVWDISSMKCMHSGFLLFCSVHATFTACLSILEEAQCGSSWGVLWFSFPATMVVFWRVFLTRIKGLRTEAVVDLTDEQPAEALGL